MEDGKVDPDVWAIGDAAIIKTAVLPATAQGSDFSFTISPHSISPSSFLRQFQACEPGGNEFTLFVTFPIRLSRLALSDLSAVANQKARYLSKKLNRIVRDKEHTEPFEFFNQGSLAYIGDWCVSFSTRVLLLCSVRSVEDLSLMSWDCRSRQLLIYRKAIYDRSSAETGIKARETGRVAWLLWRSAYFTMTLSLRNK